MGVKELLSIGEAACTDLINSNHIKLLCHKGLCCLRRLRMQGGVGGDWGNLTKWVKSVIAIDCHSLSTDDS